MKTPLKRGNNKFALPPHEFSCCRMHTNTVYVVAVGVLVTCHYFYIAILSTETSLGTDRSDDEPTIEVVKRSFSSGEEIVRMSYLDTYNHINCPHNQTMRTCLLETTKGYKNAVSGRNKTMRVPWWFRTLLRDAVRRGGGLFGPWHDLRTTSPSLRMCTIEKVATTQWRKVFCFLNNKTFTGVPCGPGKEPPQDAPRILFLRDPLERFLSAFLDKCDQRRLQYKHCEPNPVFNSEENGMMHGLLEDKRLLFDAFVDSMPLKWNMHFFPFSLYCDGLYRSVDKYDFVGHMGTGFYADLEALGKRYGEQMTKALEAVFHVSKKVDYVNYGVETKAPREVDQYYTSRTVRRVLEYHAIDYVMLNLTIPQWARRILEKEESLSASREDTIV